jgi:hypothetical protein
MRGRFRRICFHTCSRTEMPRCGRWSQGPPRRVDGTGLRRTAGAGAESARRPIVAEPAHWRVCARSNCRVKKGGKVGRDSVSAVCRSPARRCRQAQGERANSPCPPPGKILECAGLTALFLFPPKPADPPSQSGVKPPHSKGRNAPGESPSWRVRGGSNRSAVKMARRQRPRPT